jgi:hypothetical protein
MSRYIVKVMYLKITKKTSYNLRWREYGKASRLRRIFFGHLAVTVFTRLASFA